MYVVGNGAPVVLRDSVLPSNSSIYICSSIVEYGNPDSVHNRISAYDFHGNLRNRWYMIDGDFFYTPVPQDFAKDGNMELFTGEQNYHDFIFSMSGLVIPGWPQNGSDAFQWQSCVGKVINNNRLFAVSPVQSAYLDSLNVPRGRLHAYDYHGIEQPNWPLKPLYLIMGTTFSDLNNDGSVEILTSGASGTSSALNIYTIPGIPFNKENFPWPMFAHDRYRTNQLGFVPPEEPIGIQPVSQNIPGKFMLYQNYPNPFNPSTIIKFDVSVRSSVKLEIFDITGRELSHSDFASLQPGTYKIDWDANMYSSGVYFYRITASTQSRNFVEVKKMVLLK